MPRYDDEEPRGYRHKLPSYSPDNQARIARDRSRGRDRRAHDREDKSSNRGKHRRERSVSSSRPSRHSRDRKDRRSYRDRSRSRSPYEDSSRRHRRRSKERRRDGRDSSRSPRPRHPRRHDSASPSRNISPSSKRSRKPLPSQNDAFSKTPRELSEVATPAPDKEKPNFANTGRLAAETNAVRVGERNIVLKYHEPPEARKPPAKNAWRLYVFKGEDLLETVELGARSCWLIGRERLVADLPIDHPSCSKQHAAIQFRYVEKRNEFGDRDGRVRPYLIDLESANGSSVNGDAAPPGRYMELMDKDVLKFGLSTREYVLMLPPPD
ncbi:FHA domain containing protein [Coccidioides posadasii C735 delta SOWgp]|uniref:FHA domain containing protein n=1 Tax=Coccidioides posadasii (strain C735) TaxID=222929 RepID=C5P9M2_COCP7|nr:FHA domain containing protein [Coccidioides posadasii C735 delta SOWgp]EER26434.1 FHA domain containing protein [Coccidioides posadasii C735 delta SOWgp]|eukprot:XP_003068579.1 FHA domain containing protein [Coccidioides posadasii C735 delta SOWgp]